MNQALIDASIYCPLCGSLRFRLDHGQRHCVDCEHRDFNNPITAVAVWIFDEQDRVFLIQRAKDPGKGLFAPPGGFVDKGEGLEMAAVREVKEETGIQLDSLDYLSSAPNLYTYRGLSRPVCDVFFVARISQAEVRADVTEVSDWEWLPKDDLNPENLAFPSMRQSWTNLR